MYVYTHTHVNTHISIHIYIYTYICMYIYTGWRRPIGCLLLQVMFLKRAINSRALLRKMTYKDKASYGSSPPCTRITHIQRVWQNMLQNNTETRSVAVYVHKYVRTQTHKHIHTHMYVYTHTHTHTYVCIPPILRERRNVQQW